MSFSVQPLRWASYVFFVLAILGGLLWLLSFGVDDLIHINGGFVLFACMASAYASLRVAIRVHERMAALEARLPPAQASEA